MSLPVTWYDLGQVEYMRAWDFQKHVHAKVAGGDLHAAFIACRHFPVITLGRQAKKEHILGSHKELESAGIAVHAVDRGGDVTYHGPGQLTLYPVLNLAYFKKDIHWYLRLLEEVVIDCLDGYGVAACRQSGRTGVWADSRKIASIGIGVKQWISFHGVSVNIKAQDLPGYALIKPCGMDIRMTSLETQIKQNVEIERAGERLRASCIKSFHLKQEYVCVQG